MSSTAQPSGVKRNWRRVVVWRLLSSFSRIAAVTVTSSLKSALTRVNFPTPDDPRNATVCPNPQYRESLAIGSRLKALSNSTTTRFEIALSASTYGAGRPKWNKRHQDFPYHIQALSMELNHSDRHRIGRVFNAGLFAKEWIPAKFLQSKKIAF